MGPLYVYGASGELLEHQNGILERADRLPIENQGHAILPSNVIYSVVAIPSESYHTSEYQFQQYDLPNVVNGDYHMTGVYPTHRVHAIHTCYTPAVTPPHAAGRAPTSPTPNVMHPEYHVPNNRAAEKTHGVCQNQTQQPVANKEISSNAQ